MKKLVLATLVLIILFSGFVSADVGKKVEWKEAPPLAPWTALFSYKTSSNGIFGEIIIAEKEDNIPPKLFGTTIYSEMKSEENKTVFFEAIYISDEKPEELIELIERGKGKYPSALKKEELKQISEMIRRGKNWIILHDHIVKASPF